MSAILGTAVPGAGGSAYTIDNSLRFRRSASAYLNRTPASDGNRKTWTQSLWVKNPLASDNSIARSLIGIVQNSSQTQYRVFFDENFNLRVFSFESGSFQFNFTTTRVFRDPSAWYHIIIALDTTQATSSNRVKIYVNGSQETAFSTATYPSLNADCNWNRSMLSQIGASGATDAYLDGYLTEVNFIDGQALTPSSFGETNASTGVWQPKEYTGTYGTNGFYLPFSNQSTATYAGSFNGSNQFLSVAQNNAFSFGTGDFTVEAWVYANSWNSVNPIIALGDGAVGGGSPVYSGWVMRYDSSNGIIWYRNDTGGETSLVSGATLGTNKWNHIAICKSSGTLRMFANGVQVYSAANSISYNNVNSDSLKIGGNWRIGGGVVTWVNGLISNARIVKGTALYTANFVPSTQPLTNVSGTSLLTLQNASIVDNSSNAFSITNNNSVSTSIQNPFAATGIAADQSGNANNWNTNNISLASGVTYDSMTDSPTPASSTVGNYAVLNPLDKFSDLTIQNGNLTFFRTSSGLVACRSTMPISGQKIYCEYTLGSNPGVIVGVGTANMSLGGFVGIDANGWGWQPVSGAKFWNNSTFSNYGSDSVSGDVIMMAIDQANQKIWWGKNGTWFNSGNPATGTNPAGFSNPIPATGDLFIAGSSQNSQNADFNFGQRPFAYTPPSGFNRLQTFNLPTPTIGASATTLANKYFNATLYTGNGSTQTITNSGSMQPDMVWVKSRSNAYNNVINDAVRGSTKLLITNATDAEQTETQSITSFNSNGFSLGTAGTWNQNGSTFVGWQWRASNATAVTNTAGSITSTVSANTTSGFSIVTYTGTGANATVGHGLGVAPNFIIIKCRSNATNWFVGGSNIASAGNGTWSSVMEGLNTTSAINTGATAVFNSTAPTSSVFSLGTELNANGNGRTFVAYCFAQVAGYSAFGRYTGNGSADGTFVYTGFRPRYVMIKRTDSGNNWFILDTARDTFNLANDQLLANSSAVESTNTDCNIDMVSNGFKLRTSLDASNASGGTYIYMAFAETPFNYSLAR